MAEVSPLSGNDVTRLLGAAGQGDEGARQALLELVYDELRQVAAAHLRRERGDHTLQPTALVHEAYLRLGLDRQAGWENRAHFFAACARAIRRILVEHARGRDRLKRGAGSGHRVPLSEVAAAAPPPPIDVIALDEAIRRMAELDPDRAAVVELRFFAGMTIEQTAACLGRSVPTVTRFWRLAKAWLYRELGGETP